MQTRVFRFIDHAHPAAAELFDNAIMRNSPPNHVAKSYVGEPGKSMNTSFLRDGKLCRRGIQICDW